MLTHQPICRPQWGTRRARKLAVDTRDFSVFFAISVLLPVNHYTTRIACSRCRMSSSFALRNNIKKTSSLCSRSIAFSPVTLLSFYLALPHGGVSALLLPSTRCGHDSDFPSENSFMQTFHPNLFPLSTASLRSSSANHITMPA